MCAVVFSAALVTFVIPAGTEILVVKARGEKNPASSLDEVVILSINAGNKQIVLNPTNGKWFWVGDYYMWRNERDERQPAGTTRTIAFAIPVGRKRSITFLNCTWVGKVDVSLLGGKTVTVDTYSPSVQNKKIAVNDSETSLIIKEYGKKTVCFIIITVILFLLFTGLFKRRRYITGFVVKRRFYFALLALSLMMFMSMVSLSGKCSFWDDEMTLLGASSLPLDQFFKSIITIALPAVVGFIWYHLTPFGEENMRLLPEILMALAVFCTGLAANAVLGKRAGLYAALLASTSVFLARFGNNFYIYPYYVLFATLVIWIYFYRLKSRGQKKYGHLVLYGTALAALVYSQPLGVVFPFIFFLSDAALYLKKKITLKYFYSYLLAFILYSPMLINVLFVRKIDVFHFWPGVPQFTAVLGVYPEIMSNNKLFIWIYRISVGIFFADIIARRKISLRDYILLLCIAAPALMIGIMYIYSHYINPRGSFWVTRYFSCLFPMIAIVCAYALEKTCAYIAKYFFTAKQINTFLFILLLFVRFPVFYTELAKYPQYLIEHFEAGTKWLRSQNDIYIPETAVLTNIGTLPRRAWDLYYISRHGKARADPFKLVNDKSLKDLSYKRIYVFNPHLPSTEFQKNILDKYYDKSSEEKNLNITVYDLKKSSGEER
jgi:hypothetical protein